MAGVEPQHVIDGLFAALVVEADPLAFLGLQAAKESQIAVAFDESSLCESGRW